MIRSIAAILLVLAAAASTALAAPDKDCPACKRPAADAAWKFCPYDGEPLVARATPHPQAGTLTAQPAPGGAGQGVGNPMNAVEEFFEAIAAGDDRGVRRLGRWEAFFGLEAGADLEAKTADYVKRVMAKVRPTLAGRERKLAHINLGPERADLKIEIRDKTTMQTAAVYDFTLTKGGDGWKIVAIRP